MVEWLTKPMLPTVTWDTDVTGDMALLTSYFSPREGGGDLTPLGSPRIYRRQRHSRDLNSKRSGPEERRTGWEQGKQL